MKDDRSIRSASATETSLPTRSAPFLRVLVADDDRDILRINAEALRRAGYEVDVAQDGVVAWAALQISNYALLVTDNVMPGMSGVDLIRKLRDARMSLPIIMVTGTPPTHEFDRCPALQPSAILLKPYTAADLLSLVASVLQESAIPSAPGPVSLDQSINPEPIPQTAVLPGVPEPRSLSHPHRILIVDEDDDLRMLYTEALSGPDYQVDAVEDGDAAWEALQQRNYNLLITEYEIPKLTGLELVRKLRAAHMDLPVVLAAGRLPVHELAQNPSLQLAATLVKPFAVDALLETVKNALRVALPPPEQTWGSPPAVDGWHP